MRLHEKREVIQSTLFTMLMVYFKLHILIHIILLKINDEHKHFDREVYKFREN